MWNISFWYNKTGIGTYRNVCKTILPVNVHKFIITIIIPILRMEKKIIFKIIVQTKLVNFLIK